MNLCYFGLAETITNQSVAVACLLIVLSGLGWLIKQLISLTPTILERMDKQEDRRVESMERMTDRIDASIGRMAEKFHDCMCEIKDGIKKSNTKTTRTTKTISTKPGSNGKANVSTSTISKNNKTKKGGE